ncbi:MAG: C40 family peptidase [Phocaeicola sp.]
MRKIAQKLFLFILFTTLLSACKTVTPNYNYKELAQASIRLGVDIEKKDNHKLYIESAHWIGVPHRIGGTTKKGVDCSGLTMRLYKKVYHKSLERNSNEQLTKNCHRIAKSKLCEGDLVFFHNGKKKKQASHVGIYLKDNLFIHTSTSRGVMVSSLNESYYKKHWLAAGRKK